MFDAKINADSREVLSRENVLGLATQQGGFAYAAVACEDDFEEHLMSVG